MQILNKSAVTNDRTINELKKRTIELELGYIRLQKYVNFGGGLVDALLDRDRYAFQQLRKFKLLFLSYLETPK